jgi:hypothetical protein
MLIAETAYGGEFLCVLAIGISHFRYINQLSIATNLTTTPQIQTVIPCE